MCRALYFLFTTSVLLVLLAATCAAQTAAEIDVTLERQAPLGIALADPVNTGSATVNMTESLQKELIHNIGFLPFLKIIPADAILGGNTPAGFLADSVDFKRYQIAGSDYVLTTGWTNGNTVELRVFQAFTRELFLGKSYDDVSLNKITLVADRFCEALMEKLTGNGEFFRSTLAFDRSTGPKEKNIFVCHATGRNVRQVTNLKGLSLSPAWSQDMGRIAFTFIDGRYHNLGILNTATGKVGTHRFKGSIIGPAFTPGGDIALGMSDGGGESDIFLLNRSYKVIRTLVSHMGIDISPSYDKSGSIMAYVSDRFGGPQIFILGRGQVTHEGSYNTDPSVSPDGTKLAYVRRTSEGFRIFVQDLATGAEQQVSFGPGNDEQPAFAPDNYFIAFSSTRVGGHRLFLTNRHGADAVQIPTGGDAMSPAWGIR